MNRRSFFGALLAAPAALAALARKAKAKPEEVEVLLTFGDQTQDVVFFAPMFVAEKLRPFADGGPVRSVRIESEVLWDQR